MQQIHYTSFFQPIVVLLKHNDVRFQSLLVKLKLQLVRNLQISSDCFLNADTQADQSFAKLSWSRRNQLKAIRVEEHSMVSILLVPLACATVSRGCSPKAISCVHQFDVNVLQECVDGRINQKFSPLCSMQQQLQYSFEYLQEKVFSDSQWKMMNLKMQMDLHYVPHVVDITFDKDLRCRLN